MKKHYIIFLAIVALFTLMYLPKIGNGVYNPDLVKVLVVKEYYSIIECNGQTFESYGLPQTGVKCMSNDYCKENWPAGPSFQIRDKSGACCVYNGECGKFITEA